MIQPFLAFALLCGLAYPALSQGLLLAQMQCGTNYRGIAFEGVIEVQLYQYAGSVGIGASGDRTQLNLLIKSGRAHEIHGTLYMMGAFQGGGTIVHVEAPNMVAGRGTGSIVVGGQVHRATYANFAIVRGGIVAMTENGERIDYRCR